VDAASKAEASDQVKRNVRRFERLDTFAPAGRTLDLRSETGRRVVFSERLASWQASIGQRSFATS